MVGGRPEQIIRRRRKSSVKGVVHSNHVVKGISYHREAPLTDEEKANIALRVDEQMDEKKEDILRVIQTFTPRGFHLLQEGYPLNVRVMPEQILNMLGTIVGDPGSYPTDSFDWDFDIKQERLTAEMAQFTRDNICNLEQMRQEEMARVVISAVPSIGALGDGFHGLVAEELPEDVQICLYKYIKKHVTSDLQQTQSASQDEEEVEKEFDGGEDHPFVMDDTEDGLWHEALEEKS